MGDPAKKESANPVDVEGLEVLFSPGLEVLQADSQEGVEVFQEGSISLARAASLLGIHRRYALDLVRTGKLHGLKDHKGQWLVSATSVKSRLEATSSKLQEGPLEDSRRGLEINLEGVEPPKEDPRDQIIKELQTKLEAASFRIGYLQHQVESQESEIRLLTDSRHKSSWWLRFCSWLKGQSQGS